MKHQIETKHIYPHEDANCEKCGSPWVNNSRTCEEYRKGKIVCQKPCKDYIFAGCGNKECTSQCHQPIWYYDKNYKGEKSEEAAYAHRYDLYNPNKTK